MVANLTITGVISLFLQSRLDRTERVMSKVICYLGTDFDLDPSINRFVL